MPTFFNGIIYCMARKKGYSEKHIIEASIDLIAKFGKEKFSVRNVAYHLNASTQPIYSYFNNSDQLYHMVMLEIEKRLLNNINRPYSEYVFRNVGIGFILFAKDNPNLFDAFFSDLQMNKTFVEKFLTKLRDIVDTDGRFNEISASGKDTLLETMWTFSYGYAFLIIKGIANDTSEEAIKSMVAETGMAVISYLLHKEGIKT